MDHLPLPSLTRAIGILTLTGALCASLALAGPRTPGDDAPAGATATAKDTEPAPLLDENGQPFPPARPTAPVFNPEIAAARFAALAMQDTLLEMAMARLVERQGQSPLAKDLAHRLLTNHTAIKLILTKASAGTLEAFPPIDEEAQATLDRLGRLSGAELDHEYLWVESLRQPRQMAMYRWQYENCDDKRLKQFAVGTLPIISVHARLADEIHRKVNAEEIALQEKRAEAERKAEQARKQAEAQAAAKKPPRKFKK